MAIMITGFTSIAAMTSQSKRSIDANIRRLQSVIRGGSDINVIMQVTSDANFDNYVLHWSNVQAWPRYII